MHNPSINYAMLTDISGLHLPPLTLQIDARYQMAVSYGAHAAEAFFNEDTANSLHKHLPASLAHFLNQSKQSALLLGISFDGFRQALSDAFIAGYMGRIQQELRLIRPSPPRQRYAERPH